MVMANIAVLQRDWLGRSLRLFSVSLSLIYCNGVAVCSYHLACLFQRLPNLKVAIPPEEVEYSNLHADVGIVKLPVVW